MTLGQIREFLTNERICLYESIWDCDLQPIHGPIQPPRGKADPVKTLYNALMLYCHGENVTPDNIIQSIKKSFVGSRIVFPSGKHMHIGDLLEIICTICNESDDYDPENENSHVLLNKQLVAMARMSVNHGRRTVRYTTMWDSYFQDIYEKNFVYRGPLMDIIANELLQILELLYTAEHGTDYLIPPSGTNYREPIEWH